MHTFSLIIEYLTGYAVATDPASRERAEWPPHPARVFMALAAAHFETVGAAEQRQAERAAIEWLAALEPPDLVVPACTLRDVLTVFVPVNDQVGAEALLTRSRQPRTFPRVHLGAEPLRLTWRYASDEAAVHLAALEVICRNVTRIGHSSSLVWVRIDRDSVAEPTHRAQANGLGLKLRTPFSSMLRTLRDDFGQDNRDEHARLTSAIELLDAERKQLKGKGTKDRKAEIGGEIERIGKERSDRFGDQPPRGPIRPRVSHTTSYEPVQIKHAEGVQSPFDPNFIVLREDEDATQSFGLESTAQITLALRNLILKESRVQPPPAWASGHEPNGDPLTSGPHLAIIPLAFVAHEHADGHLLGVGIVLPNAVPHRERSEVLGPLLFHDMSEPRPLRLTLGRAGAWDIERETSFTPKWSLRPLTYTGPSLTWASVTPVVLDRMPKIDRMMHPLEWREEVAGIIAQSCANGGLPRPVAVRVEKTPLFRGSLRAMPGQGGFPQLRAGRFQVHAQITFDVPVGGPVLIGAGRFRGYGLMRPWSG
jgi:CRISPR-associated protein Csb2